LAFALLFRIPTRIYCNSDAVKNALLTTGADSERVASIPHFSTHYIQFTPAALAREVEDFYRRHEGVFFLYICFRKEYALEFLVEAMRRFRAQFPRIGFLLVGTSNRELQPLKEFLSKEGLEDVVYLTGSVPHNIFLTMMRRSLAYIRIPLTDGTCSSVLEALALKVPVLASDNGTRPAGAELWKHGDLDSLLASMYDAVRSHARMVSRIPNIVIEDNVKRLADSIERVCCDNEVARDPCELDVQGELR
jgi:hypothetical protein